MRIVVDTIWWSHLTSLLRRLLGISLRKFGLQATTARCRFEIVQQRTNHLPELILGLGITVVNLEAELVIVLKTFNTRQDLQQSEQHSSHSCLARSSPSHSAGE